MDLITRGRGAFVHDFAHKVPLTKIVHLENGKIFLEPNYEKNTVNLKKINMIG